MSNYDDVIAQAATQVGVDYKTLRSFAQIESNFKADAKSQTKVKGLFQITQATFNENAETDYERQNQYDPKVQATVAARYIKKLSSRLSNLQEVATAYNAGEGIVQKAKILQKEQGISFEEAVYKAAYNHFGTISKAKESANYYGRLNDAMNNQKHQDKNFSNIDVNAQSEVSTTPKKDEDKKKPFLLSLGPGLESFQKLEKTLKYVKDADKNLRKLFGL